MAYPSIKAMLEDVLTRIRLVERQLTRKANVEPNPPGGKVLFSSPGVYMQASQVATLSESIRKQPTGVVLVWSEYSNGSSDNWGWHFHVIPKSLRDLPSGYISLPFTGGIEKRIYLTSDTVFTGHGNNNQSPANKYVLRQIVAI